MGYEVMSLWCRYPGGNWIRHHGRGGRGQVQGHRPIRGRQAQRPRVSQLPDALHAQRRRMRRSRQPYQT